MTREKGFTLLESLVALSLITILLITVLQVAGSGAAKTKRTEHVVEAASIATSLFAKLGVDKPIVPGLSSGSTGESENWNLNIVQRGLPKEIQPTQGLLLNIFDITVTVEIDDQIYQFNTVRSAPVRVAQ